MTEKTHTFKKLAYWTIGVLVMIVPTYHYQRVFIQYEHNTIFGESISWIMGAIFDGTGLLFLYHFTRLAGKLKYFLMAILIGFIYFLHFQYYSQTVFNIWINGLLSAVWPYMMVLVSYLGVKINRPIEVEKASEQEEINGSYSTLPIPKRGLIEKKTVNLKMEPKQEKKLRPKKKTHGRYVSIHDCFDQESGAYLCPGCGKPFTKNGLNGHRWRECVKKNGVKNV